MKKKKAAPKSLLRSLTRSILLVHFCVLAFSLVLSFVLLLSTSKKQYVKQSQASMDLIVMQLDSLAENLLDIRNSCLLDNQFCEYLDTPRTYTLSDIRLQKAVIDKLSVYLPTHYIDSFTVYQGNSTTLNVSSSNRINTQQSRTSMSVQQTQAYLNAGKNHLTWGGIYPYNQLLPSYYPNKNYSSRVISLLISLGDISDDSANSVLAVNIPEDYLHKIFEQNVPSGCFVSLFDSSGNLLLTNSQDSGSRKYDSVLSQSLQYTDWHLEITIPFSVFFQNVRTLLAISSSIFLIASLLVTVITSIVGRRLLNPFQDIILQMDEIHSGNLEQRLSSQKYVELNNLTGHFNKLMDRIQQLIQTTQSYAEEKRMLEVQALQSQINPHFIYNSLTTIRWMASMARAENVCQALLSLSNVLRPVFSDSSSFWSLKAEQNFLENYIAIMGYRIGYKTRLLFEISEEHQELAVPRFVLQPIVENSLMHGLSTTYDESVREIRINSEKSDLFFDIFISDNGKGIAPALRDQMNADMQIGMPVKKSADRNSIGLYNVNRRIQLQYGEGSGLQIMPASQGAVIRVRLSVSDSDKNSVT